MLFRIGDTVNGGQRGKNYKILEFIGHGGFGEVYKAEDGEKQVAIKALPSYSDISQAETLEIAKNEAEAGMKMQNENVVKIYDYGQSAAESEKTSFIVMELLTKNDLRLVIDDFRASRIGIPEVENYVRQIFNGMVAIHEVLLHRDLKPENILIATDGMLKITDFGMSKYVDESTRTKTFKGGGTMPYMAPETWELGTTAKSTDIYALGIILYQIFTGELPFSGSSDREWRSAHLFSPIPRAIKKNPLVSLKMDDIIHKAMSKDMRGRYQTVQELQESMQTAWEATPDTPSFVSKIVEQAKASSDIAQSAQLEEQRRHEERMEKISKIDYKVSELIDRFDAVVTQINANLEGEKISIVGEFPDVHPYPTLGGGPRSYCYQGKRVNICIFGEFGAMPESLKKAGLIAAGAMFVVNSRNMRLWGKNLLLLKKPDEAYGDWIITETEHSALIGMRYEHEPFAFVDNEEFLTDMGHHFASAMHTTVIKKFPYDDGKFAELIEKMISVPANEPDKPKTSSYYSRI